MPFIMQLPLNNISIERIVIKRHCLSKQSAIGYSIAFKKLVLLFEKHYLKLLQNSHAEIDGLKLAVGKDMAERLLKGCNLHWLCSCRHIAERIASSTDKTRARVVFLNIAGKITKLQCSVDKITRFETLHSSVRNVKDIIPTLCSDEDADFVDEDCDWFSIGHNGGRNVITLRCFLWPFHQDI